MTSAEQIKARLDVVTLVSSYIKLEKAGMNFKARCPLHSEKTASFYVSPARDIWHCFGCGKGGDIFKFVMEIDGLEFLEALHVLGDRVGVEVRRTDAKEQSARMRLFALTEDAARFFEERLVEAPAACEYLAKRGVSKESIQLFRIGFAPDSWRALGDFLKRKEYSDTEIEKAGLSIQGSRGPYDRFRSRIIFPLEDSLGRVLGFGGRLFEDPGTSSPSGSTGGKYINTPQTALYDKSRYLYGLAKAKEGIHRKKSIVLVEGYLDLILSHQAGVENTVAVSGTALTESHIKILRRISDSLIFSFDVDRAGIEASRRALGLAHTADFTVRIVDIEGGKDPADIVCADSAHWRKLVEEARESISFFLKKSIASHAPLDPISKKKIGADILPLVARLSNEIEKSHWVSELGKLIKVGEDAIRRELMKIKETGTVEFQEDTEKKEAPLPSRRARLEERIAGFILLDPGLASLGDIPTRPECALATTGALFERLPTRPQGATVEEFLRDLPEDVARDASRLMFEAEIALVDLPDRETEFLSLLHSWRELVIKDKLERLREEIEQQERIGDTQASHAHMCEFQDLTVRLAHIMSNHLYYNDKKNKKES